MEAMTKTSGPYPGGLILTHTHTFPPYLQAKLWEISREGLRAADSFSS